MVLVLILFLLTFKWLFLYRALEEKRARLGLVECMNHELLQPYPVLHEKPGNIIYAADTSDTDCHVCLSTVNMPLHGCIFFR